MKAIITLAAGLCLSAPLLAADKEHAFDPPWGPLPEGNSFTVPGIDNVPDLHGEINDPQLVVFFAGNQFMVVDELLDAFKKQHPEIERIFVETLPPGILAKQVEAGSLTIGKMKITLKPDIFAAGKDRMALMQDSFSRTETYAYNRLSIMVAKGNPGQVKSLADLGKKDVQVSMPNPAWEGVGKKIEEAYVKAGGEALRHSIMEEKVTAGTTYLTQIHHRQTPMRILYGQSQAGPVWHTEAAYQISLGNPVEEVAIPEGQNILATYIAGQMKNAPHAEAAKLFLDFMTGDEVAAIYKKYGFLPKS